MQLGDTGRGAEPDGVSSTSRSISDPRVYLAAERTFLAWVRTSISLMGFGFVIARFALWTREFGSFGRSAVACTVAHVSTWLGFGMVCVGVFVSVLGGGSPSRLYPAPWSRASPARPCTSRPR